MEAATLVHASSVITPSHGRECTDRNFPRDSRVPVPTDRNDGGRLTQMLGLMPDPAVSAPSGAPEAVHEGECAGESTMVGFAVTSGSTCGEALAEP